MICHGMLIIALATAAYQGPGDAASDAVRLHESGVALLGMADATLEVGIHGAKDGFRDPVQRSTLHWSRQGGRQRVRQELHLSTAISEPIYTDVMIDGPLLKRLAGWDPAHPPVLTPVDSGGVKASIEPFSGKFRAPLVSPLVLLNLEFVMSGDEAPRPLAKLVRDAGQGVRAETVTVDGNRFVRLVVPHTSESGQHTDSIYTIDLDPEHNFLARRVEARAVNLSDGTAPPMSFRNVTEVLEFKEVAEGIHFPTRLECRGYQGESDQPINIVKTQVDVRSIGSPPAPAAFDFRFPEYSLVRTLTPVNGRVKTELWGADDRPIQAINDQEDLIEIAKARGFSVASLYGNQPRSSWISWPVLASSLVACMVVATILLRRRGRRHPGLA